MRPFEVLLVLLTMAMALSLLESRLQPLSRWCTAICFAVLGTHLVLERAHWQMIPAYAAAVIAGVATLIPFGANLPRRLAVVGSSLVLAFATLLASFVFPMFRLPKPTGPYPVGTTILYFKDAFRLDDASPEGRSPRELMVQLWYPAAKSRNPIAPYRELLETTGLSSYQSVLATNSRRDAPIAVSDAPFPVILVNHSWGGRRTNYTFLTEELASHGYVVASIDHTYNAHRVAFPDGRVVRENASADIDNVDASTVARVEAVWEKELVKSVADEKYVLDQLEKMNTTVGSAWQNRLNTANAGALGHSFGGSAATELCAVDKRVRASVNVDGWFFDAIHARGTNQPVLFLSEYMDEAALARVAPDAPVEQQLDKIDFSDMRASFQHYGGYRVEILGSEHNDYSDQPLVSPLRSIAHRGTVPATRLHTIIRAYVLAFFDKELRGTNPEILRPDSRPFTEATFEAWPDSRSSVARSDTRESGR